MIGRSPTFPALFRSFNAYRFEYLEIFIYLFVERLFHIETVIKKIRYSLYLIISIQIVLL